MGQLIGTHVDGVLFWTQLLSFSAGVIETSHQVSLAMNHFKSEVVGTERGNVLFSFEGVDAGRKGMRHL